MAANTDTRDRDTRHGETEETASFLCRLPKSLNKKLKERAFREERPKAEIVRQALSEYLDKA